MKSVNLDATPDQLPVTAVDMSCPAPSTGAEPFEASSRSRPVEQLSLHHGVVTYDERMAQAARAMGLTVAAPP